MKAEFAMSAMDEKRSMNVLEKFRGKWNGLFANEFARTRFFEDTQVILVATFWVGVIVLTILSGCSSIPTDGKSDSSERLRYERVVDRW